MIEISPSSGSVKGGTEITITGSGFSTRKGDNQILLDNQNNVCEITSIPDNNTIKCITPELPDSLTADSPVEVILLGRIEE
mmetsp:Transcript_25716/g.4323  ORF Transcript_25716/g.4323 Transcript_25716/m.4323 type:complete len:81 (+) Transcript_25716:2956-3198(+)